MPYEMFLIYKFIWLVGKIAYIHLQETKDETCSEEQVTTVQDKE